MAVWSLVGCHPHEGMKQTLNLVVKIKVEVLILKVFSLISFKAQLAYQPITILLFLCEFLSGGGGG